MWFSCNWHLSHHAPDHAGFKIIACALYVCVRASHHPELHAQRLGLRSGEMLSMTCNGERLLELCCDFRWHTRTCFSFSLYESCDLTALRGSAASRSDCRGDDDDEGALRSLVRHGCSSFASFCSSITFRSEDLALCFHSSFCNP